LNVNSWLLVVFCIDERESMALILLWCTFQFEFLLCSYLLSRCRCRDEISDVA
jgi:hypothetical protein